MGIAANEGVGDCCHPFASNRLWSTAKTGFESLRVASAEWIGAGAVNTTRGLSGAAASVTAFGPACESLALTSAKWTGVGGR